MVNCTSYIPIYLYMNINIVFTKHFNTNLLVQYEYTCVGTYVFIGTMKVIKSIGNKPKTRFELI